MTGGDEGPGVASPELNDVFLPYRVPHDDGRSQRFDASWIRLPVAPKSLPHHVVFELRVLLEGQAREGFQQEAPMAHGNDQHCMNSHWRAIIGKTLSFAL